MKPAEYWRKKGNWSNLLFKTGTVVQSTQIFIPPTAQALFSPYSFLIISVEEKKMEVMGVPGVTFVKGDAVRLVLRRLASNTPSQPIPYGLKAEKL